MRRKLIALGVAAAIAAAGCSHAKPHDPPATTITRPLSAGPNPDVIPPVITVAYVNSVFAKLNHIEGDASRTLIKDHLVTSGVLTDLRAVFNDPLYRQEVKIAHQSVQGDLSNVRQPPGDIVTKVRKLISATSTCIFVETESDYSAVLVNPGRPAGSEYWGLKPKQVGIDPLRLNATPWALNFDAVYLKPTNIPDQCAAP